MRQRPAHNPPGGPDLPRVPGALPRHRAAPAHCPGGLKSAWDRSSPVNSAGSRSRHLAWATQSVALLRPWLIGTRSACAGGPTSRPPPHRIVSRLPAAGVKPVPTCRGRYSAERCKAHRPGACANCAGRLGFQVGRLVQHPGHRAGSRGQLVDLQVRGLLGRRHPRTAQQLRRAPGRTANARPGPDARRGFRTPVALHGQSPRPA